MTARDLLAPCMGAALLGGMFVNACDHDRQAAGSSQSADSARAEGETLPRMHAIPADTTSGSVERVKGFRVFQAGDCTVWRFTDSVGTHYLAEGRTPVAAYHEETVACAVAR